MIKNIFYLILTLSFWACTHGNCRNQSEAMANVNPQLAKSSEKTNEEIAAMKQTSVAERVMVHKPDGSLQCGQGHKIELDKMAQELKGIKIYSQANKNDGMMRIQLCGSPTGNSNIFEIDRINLEKAIALGFKEWTGG